MDPQQIYEESIRLARESHANMVHIKWTLICIAVNLWGIALYFLFKEIPRWRKSFDKEEEKRFSLDQMNKDLEGSTRPRKNLWDWNDPK